MCFVLTWAAQPRTCVGHSQSGRSDAWLDFSCVRSVIVSKMAGGVSELVKDVLTMFGDGQSFLTGVAIPFGDEATLLRAEFGGFLGDDNGLKDS